MPLVGLQYGSEGKGVVAAGLADACVASVRVGGANAGHTIMHNGTKFVMRHVPCAWINKDAALYIGPGGLLDLDVLDAEIRAVEAAGYSIRPRLFIHENAAVVRPHSHRREEDLVAKIGSTAEGIGDTIAAKVMRRDSDLTIRLNDNARSWVHGHIHLSAVISPQDYSRAMTGHLMRGNVICEGTQGFGLSLDHGPWPFCTGRDTTPASLVGACGLPLSRVGPSIGVARTYPIRVGGNSGPLPGETSWQALGREPEITTVTKRVRRIAKFDWQQFEYALATCGVTDLVLTFIDYLDDEQVEPFIELAAEVAEKYGTRLSATCSGPNHATNLRFL